MLARRRRRAGLLGTLASALLLLGALPAECAPAAVGPAPHAALASAAAHAHGPDAPESCRRCEPKSDADDPAAPCLPGAGCAAPSLPATVPALAVAPTVSGPAEAGVPGAPLRADRDILTPPPRL